MNWLERAWIRVFQSRKAILGRRTPITVISIANQDVLNVVTTYTVHQQGRVTRGRKPHYSPVAIVENEIILASHNDTCRSAVNLNPLSGLDVRVIVVPRYICAEILGADPKLNNQSDHAGGGDPGSHETLANRDGVAQDLQSGLKEDRCSFGRFRTRPNEKLPKTASTRKLWGGVHSCPKARH